MSSTPILDDLNATPYEIRLSKIAADVWGIKPFREEDGEIRPLMKISDPGSDHTDNIYRARLGRFGIIGSSDYPDAPIDGGWWSPIHTADGKTVIQGGEYRYFERVGLVYTGFDSKYDELPTALLKTLKYEEDGTPIEQPHRLGAGPAIDLDAWREPPYSIFKLDFIDNSGEQS
jgi:hypothetical protein